MAKKDTPGSEVMTRRQREIAQERAAVEKRKAARSERRSWLFEPTWGQSDEGGSPVTELLGSRAGGLSPFGEDHGFPLPADRLMYAHPTDKPNRAGLMAGEEVGPLLFPKRRGKRK